MTTRNWLWGMVLITTVGSSTVAAGEELADSGRPAPMFRLPVYNPQPGGPTVVGLDRFVGPDAQDKDTKVVLLSFMASFCAPCKKELPYLQQLQEKYRARGLRVISVSIDTEAEGQKRVSELIAKNGISFPVLKDRFNLVARRWLGLKSPLPSVFLVKPDGTIFASHRGYSDDIARVLEGEVLSALGVTATATTPAP